MNNLVNPRHVGTLSFIQQSPVTGTVSKIDLKSDVTITLSIISAGTTTSVDYKLIGKTDDTKNPVNMFLYNSLLNAMYAVNNIEASIEKDIGSDQQYITSVKLLEIPPKSP
ncbi:hypothetical protein [Photorhabdus bodei]|uniref:Uncharacterized protein n=1 Tax=Photorhabdus bodei TaxID=2029681 RepID=A0ABX0AUR1_9GAMM|nr:hypothetical protein [Photorhabdus bodei]NDL01289.1 hypothetical protein [Photorhabdus bodei]NDL05578.1 hypothetical protein [Photorhabdus bodei]NDL09771.1 hypothetical protein [Photorhabdus bodei]